MSYLSLNMIMSSQYVSSCVHSFHHESHIFQSVLYQVCQHIVIDPNTHRKTKFKQSLGFQLSY